MEEGKEGSSISPPEIKRTEASVFAETKEAQIREGIRWQIDNPVDTRDFHESLSEADKRYLGYGVEPQRKASLMGFSLGQAERWFQIVEEEIELAREKGVALVETDWPRLIKHEMAHIKVSSEVGCDIKRQELGVHFGRKHAPDEGQIIEFEISHLPDEKLSLHPVDQAKIDLAPDDPSFKDMMNFVQNFRSSRRMFLKRPKETSALVGKFHEASGLSVSEALKTLLGK